MKIKLEAHVKNWDKLNFHGRRLQIHAITDKSSNSVNCESGSWQIWTGPIPYIEFAAVRRLSELPLDTLVI